MLMLKVILTLVIVILFAGGCLMNFSLKDLAKDEKLKDLEVKTETNEAGEISSIDIVVETKEEATKEVEKESD